MEALIKVIQDTPIPTIFIVVGSFILILAFVTKIGGLIEVSPEQRRWAIPIGLFMLVIGLILSFASPTSVQSSLEPSPEPGTTSVQSSLEPSPESRTPPQLPDTNCPKENGMGMFFMENSDQWYSPPNATDGYELAWKKSGGFYIRNESSSSSPIFYNDLYNIGKAKRDTWLHMPNTPFSVCVDSNNNVFGKFEK